MFKLKPNKAFLAKCEQTLNVCRELYNSALLERIDAYRITGKSVNYPEQQKQLPEIKQIREDVATLHSQVVQDPLRRLHRAFEAFLQRLLQGERRAGFPRFKAENAGRRVWKIPAAYTTQDCSQCGNRVKKSLAMREHSCMACGYVTHRDHNAAQNLRARAAPIARVKGTSSDDQRIPVL